MKTLDTIRSGSQPTIFSNRKQTSLLRLESEELDVIDDTLGLSCMYLSDAVVMLDGMYNMVCSLESTDDETRETIASLYDNIKEVSLQMQSKYSIDAPTTLEAY
jgi:hypothetical protein